MKMLIYLLDLNVFLFAIICFVLYNIFVGANMDMDNYYREQNRRLMEESQELHFRLGWLKGSFAKLGQLLNDGKIKTDPYTMKVLAELVDSYATSEIRAKQNTESVKAYTESLKQQN
jgi:hypothetical protein